ncbi:hypothetical protein GCM10007170_38150 [Arthrobacter liuii]|uniref:Uncharacterized protein n=1 Tax=Arthrobacter liuii TaxID=1476996 RepID=A0ABQ2AX02_9MICC|nr:hypothetical protein GCM10007170_38150 [Arthrobacter liuii]
MKTDDMETLPQTAVQWFTDLALDAQRDLNTLPESAQPIWFRTETHLVAPGSTSE